MGRVLALDIGKKRTGIAVTDPDCRIATGLDTIDTGNLLAYLTSYFAKENVERIVVGWPVTMLNQPSEALQYIQPVVKKIQARFPNIPLEQMDERFTSSMAHAAMLEGGVPRKKRQDKALADRISAVIILQSWLEKERIRHKY